MADRESDRSRVSPWVKAFVYFHLVAITVWSIPRPSSEVLSGQVKPWGNQELVLLNNEYVQQSPLKYYLQCTGLWQYWDMFAPDPLKTDVYLTANVRFKDGSHLVYEYPRMAALGFTARYVNERYRKFFERINGDHLEYLWVPVARRIAQKVNTQPGNPPIEIGLVRHWQDIAPPGQPQAKDYKEAVFFTTAVDSTDLDPKLEEGR